MEGMVYPIGYDIKAEEIEGGNWRLLYSEFRPDGAGPLVIELEGSRDEVLNYLAAEFLGVSSLGRIQLNELLARIVEGGKKKWDGC